jgi:acyl-coenzyme A synthetase/AMP-(fatty) acid ligase
LIEVVIATLAMVAECTVIARVDELNGQVPKKLVVIYSWAAWHGHQK